MRATITRLQLPDHIGHDDIQLLLHVHHDCDDAAMRQMRSDICDSVLPLPAYANGPAIPTILVLIIPAEEGVPFEHSDEALLQKCSTSCASSMGMSTSDESGLRHRFVPAVPCLAPPRAIWWCSSLPSLSSVLLQSPAAGLGVLSWSLIYIDMRNNGTCYDENPHTCLKKGARKPA